MRWRLFCGALLASCVACEGTTTVEGGSGGSPGSTSVSTGTAGPSAPDCLESPVVHGAPCEPRVEMGPYPDVAHCTWGEDARPRCRRQALCLESGTWEVTPADTCDTPSWPAECGATPPENDSVCANLGLSCWFPEGDRCACSEWDCLGSCSYVDPPEWDCDRQPDGCPAATPNAGAPCSEQGQRCGRLCSVSVECDQGVWVWRGGDCPICASPDTPIATPEGDRAIASLREGESVYSVHQAGIVAVPLLRVASTAVRNHRVVRVELESGAVLEVSARHPTADGGTFGDLRSGDMLGEQRVSNVRIVPFAHERTHDILPASDTGTYFAAGARIGSSLARSWGASE